ncbi:DUF4625 domain-containing protein [Mucilaginibacter defluvii]|uniref:DUF4625 domain-containing protein n=2 Tax=Mucilaginibacter defluvii TaxID=1196019 RepID=A0ABP9FSF4_9SPHI
MSNTLKILTLIIVMALFIAGCSKKNDEKVDTEYPVIDLSANNAFPQQCSIIKRGETFIFRARLSDNVQLGSVSVDIHNNFDHHSHSTEVEECQMGAVKTPVNPYLLIRSFSVTEDLNEMEISQTISVPADVDAGDYHFLIRLTDKEGWQTIKGISVKIQ